jgi:hypothetical protein
MQYSSILLAASSILALVSAYPSGTPVELAPRCGTTEYGVTIQPIDSAQPDTPFPPTSSFSLIQSGGSATTTGGRNLDALVSINNIPAGAYGCQLEVSFPAGYTVTSSGNAQVNVFTLEAPFNSGTTWNSAPAAVSLWGTGTFVSGGTTIINSETCAPNLYFLFEIASDTADGSVSFTQRGPPSPAGIRLTHNC